MLAQRTPSLLKYFLWAVIGACLIALVQSIRDFADMLQLMLPSQFNLSGFLNEFPLFFKYWLTGYSVMGLFTVTGSSRILETLLLSMLVYLYLKKNGKTIFL